MPPSSWFPGGPPCGWGSWGSCPYSATGQNCLISLCLSFLNYSVWKMMLTFFAEYFERCSCKRCGPIFSIVVICWCFLTCNKLKWKFGIDFSIEAVASEKLQKITSRWSQWFSKLFFIAQYNRVAKWLWSLS